MKYHNIKIDYVDIEEHNKLGVVDLSIQSLRNMINKSTYSHDTNTFISVRIRRYRGEL